VPTWLITPLVVAAILFTAWWAENKVTVIITELRAIREDLDKLWADQSAEVEEVEEDEDEEVSP
jgi:hypothetical protein